MDRSDEWPDIMTMSGERQRLQGPIKQISIRHVGGTESIGTQFDAVVVGNDLNVINRQGPHAYSLAEKPILTIDYTDRKAGFVVGGVVLAGAGLPLAIVGIALLSEAPTARSRALIDRDTLIVFGMANTLAGLAMIGSGIYLAARTPKKPKSDMAMNMPSLHIGPTGAGMTVKF